MRCSGQNYLSRQAFCRSERPNILHNNLVSLLMITARHCSRKLHKQPAEGPEMELGTNTNASAAHKERPRR